MQDYTKEELLNPQSRYYTENPYALRPGENQSLYNTRLASRSPTSPIDASTITSSPSITPANPQPSKSIVNTVVDLTAPITGLQTQMANIQNQQGANLAETETAATEAKAGMETAQSNISNIISTRPSQAEALTAERAKYGIEPAFAEIQALVPDITSLREQINSLNEQEARAIENLQGQGRGIPLDVLNTQANKISHEYAIRTNALAANLAAKSATMESLRGNITLASNLANQAVEAKMYDTNQKLKDWQDFYDNNKELYNSLSAEKKSILDSQYNALQKEADAKRNELMKIAEWQIKYPNAGINISQDNLSSAAVKAGRAQASVDNFGLSANEKATADAVLQNPALFDKLTPTLAGKLSAYLNAKGFQVKPKLAESARKEIATMNSISSTIDDLFALADKNDGTIPGIGAFGYGSVATQAAKLGLSSEDAIKARALVGNIAGAVALMRGGTSFTPNEQTLLETYTPTINDTPDVAKIKLELLQRQIVNKNAQITEAGTTNVVGGQTSNVPGYDDYLKAINQ